MVREFLKVVYKKTVLMSNNKNSSSWPGIQVNEYVLFSIILEYVLIKFEFNSVYHFDILHIQLFKI